MTDGLREDGSTINIPPFMGVVVFTRSNEFLRLMKVEKNEFLRLMKVEKNEFLRLMKVEKMNSFD